MSKSCVDVMWKKSFGQTGTLSSHIERANGVTQNIIGREDNPPQIDDEPEPEPIHDFLLDSEEEEDDFLWDPNTAPVADWSSEKMCEFLRTKPDKLPMLKRILKKQENVYHCNPSFLCEFKAVDGLVQIWVIGTDLYNTAKYHKKYLQASKKIK